METVVRTLAQASGQEDIRIFCSEGAEDHGVSGVETLPDGRRRRQALLQQLREFKPAVVEHHQQVRQAVAIAAAMPEAAHILYRHTALRTPRNPLDAWRYDARYGKMDGFVFVSVAERKRFTDVYPRLANRAWAIPNPIDAAPWLASPETREPVIAFAGRALPEKGLDIICAALPAVLDRHPDWRVVLMLNDWEQHRVWAEPHVASLEHYGERVVLLRSAALAEVRRQMQAAAIALTPSIWAEPFGLTAIEAHAAGAALISSGRGGLREASGDHALYLDEVTPDALGAAITRLIANPAERTVMARAAQHYVLREHAPEKRAIDLRRVRQIVDLRRRLRE